LLEPLQSGILTGQSAAKPARNGWKVQRLPLSMLTPEEKLLVGCVLGDGSLNRRHKYQNVCSLKMVHTTPQLPYLEWKVDQIRPILKSKAKILRSVNNFGIEYFSWESGFSSFVHLYELLYKNKKKTFSFEFLKELGPKELSLFWCDDGGIVKSLRHKVDPRTGKAYPNLLQETYGNLAVYEPKEETEAVASWIQDLTKEKPKNVFHKKTGLYYLRFNKKQLTALVNCIKEYTPKCMYNKLDLTLIPLSERAQVQKQRAIRRHECAAT
jgi:hypothetical protein